MSVQELRQEIVRKNISKLITSMTKLEDTDNNFKQYEQFITHKIKNYRSTSVNSHEIKRKIDGFLERFKIENFPQHGELLKNLYLSVINHPLCLNHYEHDIQWAVVDFLLEVAYNPFNVMRTEEILLTFDFPSEEILHDDLKGIESESLISEIHHDCTQKLEDSELSEWSNSSDESIIDENEPVPKKRDSPRLNLEIPPPKKEEFFEEYNRFDTKCDDIQNSWWLPNFSNITTKNEFCDLWNRHSLSKHRIQEVSNTSEYCLLYEVIWMFYEPVSCKYFTFENGEITINRNVSLCSTTPEGIQSFLEFFIPYMKKINTLKTFIKNIYESKDNEIYPKTFEYYANALQELLQPFYSCILNEEQNIRSQDLGKIYTIIQLRNNLKENLDYLEKLYNIHYFVILNHNENPTHICSAHLLSGLMLHVRSAHTAESSNMAMTLYLSAVKLFCHIIDTWWKEGRLDDWQNEFLIERVSNELELSTISNEMCCRIYGKCKEKSFFVPNNVASVIQEDRILKLLMTYSLESAGLLNLLHQIDKIANLRNMSNIEERLYDILLKTFFDEVNKFSQNVGESLQTTKVVDETKTTITNEIKDSYSKIVLNTHGEAFLAMSLNLMNFKTVKKSSIPIKMNHDTVDALEIYKRLNKTSCEILPLENITYVQLSKILESRMSLANSFIVQMYKKDFEILKQLQNIRKVLLLEASDIMHYFYVKIFVLIESHKSWANSFLLTSQFDDIISSKFPELSSLFRIEITSNFKSEVTKVMDAVDQIQVIYVLKKQLKTLITDENIKAYNKVFHFLLKIKWGLWSLENLQFSKDLRKRPPYSELKMIDFLMRRLEQLRFWLIYSIQCIHFYLMTHVLQTMGRQLDEKISECKNFTEMKSIHESFVNTISEYCFQSDGNYDIKIGVEQLLNLIYVLRFEWNSCVSEIQNDSILSDDSTDSSNNYVVSSQVQDLENTYIRCHQYLANILTGEVYSKQNSYLSGLSAAFNNSMPY